MVGQVSLSGMLGVIIIGMLKKCFKLIFYDVISN